MSVKNAWSSDSSKFFVVGAATDPLAFGFDPSTMRISPLPGAGTGGAFAVPLYRGPTFTFAIVYDKQLGCRWYNTQTGQIRGSWGPAGQAVVPEHFLINRAQISGNGQYVQLQAGNTGFFVWDVTSLNVRPCYSHGGLLCDAYNALGYDAIINSAGAIDEMNTFRDGTFHCQMIITLRLNRSVAGTNRRAPPSIIPPHSPTTA
jgi:hypothetical protein